MTALRTHKRTRLAAPAVAAGLMALALPLTAPAPAVAADKDFGYSALTTATPVYVEIYEPTIPIPATPQAELQFGYTKVIADSSSSRGRSSFLWPGDAVGEGLKTIVENLGLPPEISGPIAEQGYPVQVNSNFPSGPETEADEPIPGTVMRTGATEKTTFAQTGYSSTCDTTGGEDDGAGGDAPGIPGLPEIPGLPDLPSLLGLDALMGGERQATTSRSSARTEAPAADEKPCQVPAQLGALVTFGGFQASSVTERTGDEVIGTSRSAVGEISLAGGVVKLSGVTSKVTSRSDGTTPQGKGRASYGTLTIAGQTFGIGPDGVEAAGTPSPIPGLPDAPKAALKQLGLTITVPEPSYVRDGKEVKSVVEALVVEIDTKTFTDALRTLPLQDILNQLPAELEDLTKALGAAVNLAPRVVLHLGRATSKVETAEPIDIPEVVPDNDPEPETTGGTGGGGTGGAAGGASGIAPPTDSAPATATGDAPADALENADLASGLPPLFSIPGLLLFGGIGAALVAGSYVRRLGAAALGGAGACAHGLESGLPDLRKVQ